MKLSIVIIEYHCMALVRACLDSISTHLDAIDPELIVISNSNYDSVQQATLQASLPAAKLISSGHNLGYAAGVNSALRITTGDYIYILNPDVLLTDSLITDIICKMDLDPAWAFSGPKVVDLEGHRQPSCRRFPRPWTFLLTRSFLSALPGASAERRRYFMSDETRDDPRHVDWLSGGAMLVKSGALRQIGGMDQRFFLYMEDVDWCRTAWQKNFKVMYTPTSTVIHAGQHQSIGTRALFNRHFWWHLRSLFKYFMKYRFAFFPESEQYRQCQPHLVPYHPKPSKAPEQ